MRVGGFRKRAKVGYPNHYASQESIEASTAEDKKAKYLYNCAQRAHGNFLENYSAAAICTLVGGVAYPLTAAALGSVWTVFRIMYATGYTRDDKTKGEGRLVGSGFWLAQLGLYGLVGKMAFDMITA